MNLRILSFAALTGMLAATGCGGGAGSGAIGQTSALTPPINGGVATSAAKHSLTISYRTPKGVSLSGAASTSRSPQYVSGGTTGATVYLSVATEIVSGTPPAAFPAGTAILTNFSPSGVTGTLPLSGAAIASLTGSSTATATYSITTTNSYSTTTITIPGVLGTVATFGQYVRLGAVFTDASGFVLSEAQSSPTATGPVAGQLVANNGPTYINLTLNPVPSTVYLIGNTGVDTGLGTPITTAQVPQATIPANSWEFTAYVADHAGYVIPAQDKLLGTNITTGFVPADGVVVFDNAATTTLTNSDPTDLTVVSANFVQSPLGVAAVATGGTGLIASPTGSTLDPLPTLVQAIMAAPTTQWGPGYLITGGTINGVASEVAFPGGSVGYGTNYSAGDPFNVKIAQSTASPQASTGTVNVALTETEVSSGVPGAAYKVSGFTYTGSNYPTTGFLTKVGGAAEAVTVPLSPNILPVIH